MADDELEAIRARRMAELQGQQGGADQQKMAEQRAQQEAMKQSLLGQCLDQSARTRLNTIKTVKPEKAQMVENMIIQMARSGQIPGKLCDKDLVSIMERINSTTERKTTVKFDRRRANLDDSDDDF